MSFFPKTNRKSVSFETTSLFAQSCDQVGHWDAKSFPETVANEGFVQDPLQKSNHPGGDCYNGSRDSIYRKHHFHIFIRLPGSIRSTFRVIIFHKSCCFSTFSNKKSLKSSPIKCDIFGNTQIHPQRIRSVPLGPCSHSMNSAAQVWPSPGSSFSPAEMSCPWLCSGG